MRSGRLLLLGTLLLPACGEQAGPPHRVPLVRLGGATMGTTWELLIPVRQFEGRRDSAESAVIEASAQRALDAVNAEMSTYLPDSELSRFNRYTGDDWFPVSPAVVRCIAVAHEVGAKSKQALDITIEPLVELWGFGPGRRISEPPADAAVQAALRHTGWAQLEFRETPPALRKKQPKLALDLSSTAKGHGVDRVALLLDAHGFTAWWVEIGGEVRTRGEKAPGVPWRVAIERPSTGRGRQVHETLPLRDLAVATSGDYRNAFEWQGKRYTHLIDPRTGYPTPPGLAQVSVWAEDCATADAWATALLVLGADRAYETALAEDLAVVMLIREGDGFRERKTPAFDRLHATKESK